MVFQSLPFRQPFDKVAFELRALCSDDIIHKTGTLGRTGVQEGFRFSLTKVYRNPAWNLMILYFRGIYMNPSSPPPTDVVVRAFTKIVSARLFERE